MALIVEGDDASQLEDKIQSMNVKWAETKVYIDDLAKNLEKNYLNRKASEELATLRDVHEGYQKYINNAEPFSSDVQKLNLQLETNRVSCCLFLCLPLEGSFIFSCLI
jgi:hypothetical protein